MKAGKLNIHLFFSPTLTLMKPLNWVFSIQVKMSMKPLKTMSILIGLSSMVVVTSFEYFTIFNDIEIKSILKGNKQHKEKLHYQIHVFIYTIEDLYEIIKFKNKLNRKNLRCWFSTTNRSY